MALEELPATLAGFRTLLAKQQWTPGTSAILGAFRGLAGRPRTPGEARSLIDEAAAYAYFSLTLLDIFGDRNFKALRDAAAERGPDGDPELLAEARLELAVSPYSARPLIDAIRRAWGLPSTETTTPPA